MSDPSHKLSFLVEMELDHAVTPEEANEVAIRLEATPTEELWSPLLVDSGIEAKVVSVAAEVVESELPEGEDEHSADDGEDM